MNDEKIRRRDFLRLSGKAALLGAVVGGGEYLLSLGHYTSFQPPEKNASRQRSVAPDARYPDLAAVKSGDHVQALSEAIALAGGIGRFISRSDIVTIKPNAGWDRTPEQAADTNPILVAAMVRLCLEAGAKKVVVADVSCNETRRCFRRSGIEAALEGTGAVIVWPSETNFARIDLGGEILGDWLVLKPFIECDKLINMPIVKHHGLCGLTAGMKNWYGVLGGPRNRLHQKIDTSIADLASYFRPTLTVVDATRVLFRNGPVGGSLEDVATHDTVAISTDQVAAESFAARFLNLAPSDIGYIILAEKRGLGKSAGFAIVEKELL